MHSGCATFVCAPLPQCLLLRLGGAVHMESPSDNTINNVHEHPEACDWVSPVEIGLIGQDLSCIGGYLVGLCVVILHPHFLRGEFPLTPPQVLHYFLLYNACVLLKT